MQQTLITAVSLVLADPPYGITGEEWDVKMDVSRFWDLVPKLCIQEANYALFGVSGFLIELTAAQLEWYRYPIQWIKDHKTNFRNCHSTPPRQHETIAVFSQGGLKSQAFYSPQLTHGGKLRFGTPLASRAIFMAKYMNMAMQQQSVKIIRATLCILRMIGICITHHCITLRKNLLRC